MYISAGYIALTTNVDLWHPGCDLSSQGDGLGCGCKEEHLGYVNAVRALGRAGKPCKTSLLSTCKQSCGERGWEVYELLGAHKTSVYFNFCSMVEKLHLTCFLGMWI